MEIAHVNVLEIAHHFSLCAYMIYYAYVRTHIILRMYIRTVCTYVRTYVSIRNYSVNVYTCIDTVV